MKTAEARSLGKQLADRLINEGVEDAYGLLAPVLAQRTPFRQLDLIGAAIDVTHQEIINKFLDHVAIHRTMGGWVVIAAILNQVHKEDPQHALDLCRYFIITSDTWYAADSLAERVPGQAMVKDLDLTKELLDPWRFDANRWVRRAVGVAVHFWAKRSHGNAELTDPARSLLLFLEPMFSEMEMDAVKGIGWGLKTLGRYYPHQTSVWLEDQVLKKDRFYRSIMLSKALTYLPLEVRARIRQVELT